MIWAYLDRFLQWFVPSTVPFHLLRPSTCCDRFALCDGCSSPFHASGGLVDQWTGEQPTWEVKACQLQWSKRYPKGPILGVVNWANWALDPYHSISDCRCSSSAFSCYSFSTQYIRSFIFFDNMFQYLPFCLFQCSPRWITAAVAFFPLGRVILNQRCGMSTRGHLSTSIMFGLLSSRPTRRSTSIWRRP